jgi:putative tricarboxylic transport membrane protein
MRRSGAEIALSLGVIALGIGVAAVTATLPSAGGYAGIGPNFIPGVVAGGIILLGLWLGFEAFTGGWRNAAPDDPGVRGEHAFDAAAFVWISAGLFAHMALIGWAGFVIAGTVLFACIARGFGSRRPVRDLSIGLVLALGVFLFFVKLLNVNLPGGWLSPLLGGAGI